ncbi:helix-turn-helix domain-containing protein [Magnetospirillum sulfuroxidans]|uniref:Helix-turn-helix transcriptional regulator n=1 Tax=Magnetospirillum sulfuroxidans TaxID=611300 RepID=A0ABS5IF68_9PROT|nr:helix-turn-helix transcriptional regulator [Magnetospirillum sulfuroxidans]MBR9973064.1 helix-turn-helix transcriptional regulator [Magnetospirillum sulfuroxidans]
MSHPPAAIGQRLRKVRDDLGLTQTEMASRVSVSPRTWQSWERAEYYPTAEALRFLAEQGVDVNWVLTGNMALPTQASTQDGASSSIVVSAKERGRVDPGELVIDILTPLLRQAVDDAKKVEDIDWLATATKFAMQYALKYAERQRR